MSFRFGDEDYFELDLHIYADFYDADFDDADVIYYDEPEVVEPDKDELDDAELDDDLDSDLDFDPVFLFQMEFARKYDSRDAEDFGIDETDTGHSDKFKVTVDGWTYWSAKKSNVRNNSWKERSKACKPWARHKRRALRRNVDMVEVNARYHVRILHEMREEDESFAYFLRELAEREA